MIPIFPEFKKLEQTDKQEIDDFNCKFDPYSDFNFTSMWVYNTKEIVELSKLNGNMVVKFSDYLTTEPFYSFLGLSLPEETAKILIKFSRQNIGVNKLKLIPEVTAKELKVFYIEEDTNNHDYVVDIQKLRELTGGEYMAKRNHIHKFEKEYGKLTSFMELDLMMQKQEIVQVFWDWEQTRGKIREDTQIELDAMNRLFELKEIDKFMALGLWVGDKLAGFAICEILPNDYAIYHFEKANIGYKGIFDYLKHKTAESLGKKGVKWWNIEQDLGETGLRMSKSKCRPVRMLKKYIVGLNE